MCEVARQQWAIEWRTLEITGKLAETTHGLAAAKYSQAGYNQKR
jgi:hypothetical protein